jgi:putative cardiolipin synthase
VAVVHAGYVKRRRALLEAGVTLYERRDTHLPRHGAAAGPFGSSRASLHAKTFAVDRSRVFIGSFNFDPRSAELNTEMGFVIDSPLLAQQMAYVFDNDVPKTSYAPRLTDGRVVWIERRGDDVVRHQTEPGAGFWKRAAITLLSKLPIDPLL